MLRRKLFAVLVTLTLVFTLTPLSAFAEEVMDGTSPPAQLEAAEQTGELLIGEEQGVDEESGTGEETATDEVPGEEDGNNDSGGTITEYSVIIHYIDENRNVLRDDLKGNYSPGYIIDSPHIEGYKPDSAQVVIEEGTKEYFVIYSKIAPVVGTTTSTGPKADKATPKAAAATASVKGDSRSYELTVIGEEKTPLSGGFLDTSCCIFHLLLMLLAMIALIWYTIDMKEQQARIFELEDQLDLH